MYNIRLFFCFYTIFSRALHFVINKVEKLNVEDMAHSHCRINGHLAEGSEGNLTEEAVSSSHFGFHTWDAQYTFCPCLAVPDCVVTLWV